MSYPNPRDCEHGNLRRKCEECRLRDIAKECTGIDQSPEDALYSMRSTIRQLTQQHDFDVRAKDELRATIAKLLSKEPT